MNTGLSDCSGIHLGGVPVQKVFSGDSGMRKMDELRGRVRRVRVTEKEKKAVKQKEK